MCKTIFNLKSLFRGLVLMPNFKNFQNITCAHKSGNALAFMNTISYTYTMIHVMIIVLFLT